MRLLRPAAFALVFALAAPTAFADDDDLLSPLTPLAPKKKPKAKPRPKPQPKAIKAPPPTSDSDDLLAPLAPAPKTELLVKLGGGLKGAKLFVDHKEVGALPGAAIEVSAGDHLVEVKRPGYSEFVKTVKVVAGKQTEVTASLEAVAGILSITSETDGATVLLDGKALGPAPISELVVPPGEHRVTVKKEGFEQDVHKLNVHKGKEYQVAARLTPVARTVTAYTDRPERTDLNPNDTASDNPLETGGKVEDTPVYKRWYVWAGVAAVVVGATAGTLVATQNTAPKPLTPNDVCQGKCDACIGMACFAPGF